MCKIKYQQKIWFLSFQESTEKTATLEDDDDDDDDGGHGGGGGGGNNGDGVFLPWCFASTFWFIF